jgi:exodeoxyribonuclease III
MGIHTLMLPESGRRNSTGDDYLYTGWLLKGASLPNTPLFSTNSGFRDIDRVRWDPLTRTHVMGPGSYVTQTTVPDEHIPKKGKGLTVRFALDLAKPKLLIEFRLLQGPIATARAHLARFRKLFGRKRVSALVPKGKRSKKTASRLRDLDFDEKRILVAGNQRVYTKAVNAQRFTHVLDSRVDFLKKVVAAKTFLRYCGLITGRRHDVQAPFRLQVNGGFDDVLIAITDTATGTLLRLPDVQDVTKFVGQPHRPSEPRPHGNSGTFVAITFNVNSIRHLSSIGQLVPFLTAHPFDVLTITELRGPIDQVMNLPGFLRTLRDLGIYHAILNPCSANPGLYGTAVLSRYRPLDCVSNFPAPISDEEGRTIYVIFDHCILTVTYVPTLGIDDATKAVTKIDRRRTFQSNFEKSTDEILRKFPGRPLYWSGDMNVCRTEEDIWDSRKFESDFPGCTEWERTWCERMLHKYDLVDAYTEVRSV